MYVSYSQALIIDCKFVERCSVDIRITNGWRDGLQGYCLPRVLTSPFHSSLQLPRTVCQGVPEQLL